jgi:hypothetical protein
MKPLCTKFSLVSLHFTTKYFPQKYVLKTPQSMLFLNMKHQILHENRGNAIISDIFISTFLNTRREHTGLINR